MLEVEGITKKIDTVILRDISFTVDQSDYFVLLGKSGVGKTLLLEIIAGLIEPDRGRIRLDGKDITHEKIQNRPVGIVYQDRALFPHLSVAENIAFPFRCRGIKNEEIHHRVQQIADELGMKELLHRNPGFLSAGEAQRVALARTLASEPACLLLDEPLSSLDIQARTEIRSLLRKVHASGKIIIHVTHDYEEAISLATRIAVIEDGKISQLGSVHDVFQHPGSAFIASFIGMKNVLKGELKRVHDGLGEFISGGIQFRVVTAQKAGSGFIIIRSEDIILSIAESTTSAQNAFRGVITDISFSPRKTEVTIDVGIELTSTITKSSLDKLGLRIGSDVWVQFKASAVRFIET